MYAGKELNRARRESGLTLRKLAAFADTSSAAISQIETGKRGVSFERLHSLLNLTGHRFITIPANAKTPAEVAESIQNALDGEKPLWAFRAFLAYSQILKSLDPVVRSALTLNGPETTGDPIDDASIAALVRFRLSVDSLPLPGWLDDPQFFLPTPTLLGASFSDVIPLEVEVPTAFLHHNVLFPTVALESPGYLKSLC